MNAEGWLYAGATFNAALGVFHLAFWKLFRWREELPRLGAINRGVLPVLNIMLSYVFFAMAAAQIAYAVDWVGTPLGRAATAGVTGFWMLRAALQPFFWPRTGASWAMCGVFGLGAALHALALS
jgi:hypothetical protein